MGRWDEGRAEGVPPRDGGQPLRIGTQRLRDHRHFLFAQLRELRRHMSHRTVVLTELLTDAHLLDRGAETRTGEGARQDLALDVEIGGGSELVADPSSRFSARRRANAVTASGPAVSNRVEGVDGHRVICVRQAGAPHIGQQVGAGGPTAATWTDGAGFAADDGALASSWSRCRRMAAGENPMCSASATPSAAHWPVAAGRRPPASNLGATVGRGRVDHELTIVIDPALRRRRAIARVAGQCFHNTSVTFFQAKIKEASSTG